MGIKETIIKKLFSGRWIATVAIVTTYCFVIVLCLALVVKKIINVEVFLGMFTPFALIAKEIVQGYFDRTDRGGENERCVHPIRPELHRPRRGAESIPGTGAGLSLSRIAGTQK